MIIEAKQLSDVSGDFEFYYDQSYAYRGQHSLFINIKDLLMLKNGEVSIWARHKFVNPINYIPFLHWLGVRRRVHKFNVYDDLIKIADITYERRFHKSRYVIQLSNSDTLYAYEYYKSKFYYISIYKNDKQIALIEKFISGSDLDCKYKLYLQEELPNLANVLSMFMLYFENHKTSGRLRVSLSGRGLSVHYRSRARAFYYVPLYNCYKEKFDPTWRERNFPNENFFGPINIDKNTEI